MTNWVTVKIPESVRDEAKEVDGHTYHELMEKGIESVNGATHTNTQTNSEPVVAELSDDDIQEIINAVAAKADSEGRVDSDSLAREVASQLDYTELANKVANEVEARMGGRP